MNKKRLLPLIASVVMSAAFCLTGCGGCNGCNNEVPPGEDPDNPPAVEPEVPVTTNLIDIEIDTSRVKTSFFVGENFSSSRLVVKATTKRSDRDTTQTRDVSASAKINSNAYRRTRVGEYTIKVSYTLGSVTKEKSYTVTVKDVKLEFDLSEVQTSYLVGEPLDISKLKVNATTTEYGKEPVTEDITASDNLVIDSSAFDGTKEGTYPIKATYTLTGGVIRTASFDVTTVFTKEGFNVSLAEGVSDTINLDAGSNTTSIDVSQIVVKPVDEYGRVKDTAISLTDNDYENFKIELYNGGEKLESDTNVYSGLESGTYQIWVSADSKTVEGYTIKGFALIYVVEDVVANSFKKTSTDDTTQNIGVDTMSKNWTYSIEYATNPGVAVPVSADKVTITGLDTMTATGTTANPNATRTATATYYYKLANGKTKSQSVSFTYTVIKGEGQVIEDHEYKYDQITGKNDKDVLSSADFTGVNSFITVVQSANLLYRPGTDSGMIEFKGDALQVTFKGVGTLAVKVRGAGTTALAVVGVKRTEGENEVYMSASYSSNGSNYVVTELTYPQGHMYEVVGKLASITYITFDIDEPGTYTIFNTTDAPEEEGVYLQTTRLFAIEQVDVYYETEAE